MGPDRHRAPYLCTVAPRVCTCGGPPMVLGYRTTLERAERVMDGYWAVYLAFFGDQLYWLHWSIVDTRDGRLWWRDGRRLTEEGTRGTIGTRERDGRA